jgi:hypothetical protein
MKMEIYLHRLTCLFRYVLQQRTISSLVFFSATSPFLSLDIADIISCCYFAVHVLIYLSNFAFIRSAVFHPYSLKLRYIKQHLQVTSCLFTNFVSVFVGSLTAMILNDSKSSIFASQDRHLWSKERWTLTD